MRVLLLCGVLMLALTGCGKTVDQLVKTGQDAVGVAGEIYKDAKKNAEAVKQLVEPADPSKAKP